MKKFRTLAVATVLFLSPTLGVPVAAEEIVSESEPVVEVVVDTSDEIDLPMEPVDEVTGETEEVIVDPEPEVDPSPIPDDLPGSDDIELPVDTEENDCRTDDTCESLFVERAAQACDDLYPAEAIVEGISLREACRIGASSLWTDLTTGPHAIIEPSL